jgi:AcrR family transcriptional regulator
VVEKTPLIGQERPRRIDRRQAILDAATDLFADRGFGAVSIQEIADAAGTHKTTVLYHFDTKEALYEAVLDEALGLLAQGMGEFMRGEFKRERVAYLIDQQQTFFAEHPALARLLARELLDSANPEAYLRRFVEPIYLPALRSLERSVQAGLIRPVDPALFIHDLHVQLIGYFCHRPLLERLRIGDPFSIDALIQRRNHLVDQIFRQLLPDRDAQPAGTKGGAP